MPIIKDMHHYHPINILARHVYFCPFIRGVTKVAQKKPTMGRSEARP